MGTVHDEVNVEAVGNRVVDAVEDFAEFDGPGCLLESGNPAWREIAGWARTGRLPSAGLTATNLPPVRAHPSMRICYLSLPPGR